MWTTRVSNPVCYPHFRASASVKAQQAAFATGVPPDLYAFHRYTGNSAYLYFTQDSQFQPQSAGLSPGISRLTCKPAYAPFTPSNSGQRLPPTYYRGCWHVVSRSFLLCYRHYLHRGQRFTTRRPSSLTRRCWFRVSPIDQYPSLLPPVGVWAVSQSQCGRSTSQSGYRSSAWWAVIPPTT